ncbi:acyl carrier protein phosphodiesterase [Pseudomonas mangiferae]|uniref:DUF479 domain-containing protein n=1 Tax=Pseudomonas mangiferae TaxID=2593654 RepID=A0A553H3L5_9PSED|nr:ACP phosphodiesterase [Pseudomonas mangiferae]TRX76339.1 DUF479 domain-containing protein [Pseudomonas mangiferae]
MNYLAHLHLGGPAPAQLLGSLYGDFVKGPLDGRYPADVEAAILLHRRIDIFTDSHPVTARARARFPAERRRIAGILLDLFFDHRLALNWHDYASEPLERFTSRVYGVLQTEPALPERLGLIVPHMAAQDWLGGYRAFEALDRVIVGMRTRLSRPSLMDGAYEEVAERYDRLSEDFDAFYPELMAFAQRALEDALRTVRR